MKIEINKYVISNDGIQWIVSEVATGEKGNRIERNKKYFMTFSGLIDHVSNREMMKIWNDEKERVTSILTQALVISK